ncbi:MULTISPECIES: HlyD family secretion protein [unclassified Caulobacter]|uniref:HlyD family secretion protein n=1 Tax=unclassified Caulobacter TaxID=2648921 RepID=UPI000D34B5F1|nr:MULTISPECIES: HlyD family efflux transporter periplasmic adaptor subunit [unclassified Caulobacter]PTS91211.1 hemolysin secretion protein D [Caulobacter sp. HMWF009]PTT10220.1 hemolysin secretion protein D [Caulobacter sp. HMWF025]
MPGFLRRPAFWIVIVVLGLLAGAGFYSKGQQAEKKKKLEAAAAQEEPSPYAAIANGKADVEGGIIQVAARRGGVVEAVYVQEGDVVVKDQILARQQSDEGRLAVDRATAEVAQARALQASTRVQLNTAQRELNRLGKLVSDNYVAGTRLDAARDAVDQARATLAAQEAQIATATARKNEAQYNLELTVIRAPMNGRIARRYANPGAGASTLNVSNMFDLEPDTQRIVRAEIVEADIPNVAVGQEVEIQPEGDPDKVYIGKVLRRAAVFGARKLASDDPSQRSDERVVEVVVSADGAPLLVGQRVLVKFMKPGKKAGVKRDKPTAPVAGGMTKKQ